MCSASVSNKKIRSKLTIELRASPTGEHDLIIEQIEQLNEMANKENVMKIMGIGNQKANRIALKMIEMKSKKRCDIKHL